MEKLNSELKSVIAENEQLKASLKLHKNLLEYNAQSRQPHNCKMTDSCEKQDNLSANYKTLLCEHFRYPLGCPRGKECTFAHGGDDLRKHNANMLNDHRFKTKMCENWAKTGRCAYQEQGHVCHFAHGKDDLRESGCERDIKAGDKIYFALFVTNPGSASKLEIESFFSEFGKLSSQKKKGNCLHGSHWRLFCELCGV